MSDHGDENTGDLTLTLIKVISAVVILGVSLLFGLFPLFWYVILLLIFLTKFFYNISLITNIY